MITYLMKRLDTEKKKKRIRNENKKLSEGGECVPFGAAVFVKDNVLLI